MISLILKALPLMPRMFALLKQEKTQASQESMLRLSDLCHCCMYLHAGYPDLYDSLMDLIKVTQVYSFSPYFILLCLKCSV